MVTMKYVPYFIAAIFRWVSLVAFLGATIMIWARLPELNTTTLHMSKGNAKINTYWMMDSIAAIDYTQNPRNENLALYTTSGGDAALEGSLSGLFSNLMTLMGLGDGGLLSGGFTPIDPWMQADKICAMVSNVAAVFTINQDNDDDMIYTQVTSAGLYSEPLPSKSKKEWPEKLVCAALLAEAAKDFPTESVAMTASRENKCIKSAYNLGMVLVSERCLAATCGNSNTLWQHSVRFKSQYSMETCYQSRMQDVHITPNDHSSGMISTQHTQTLVVLCLLIVWMWGWYSITRFKNSGSSTSDSMLSRAALSFLERKYGPESDAPVSNGKMWAIALFILSTVICGFGHIIAFSTEMVSKIDNNPQTTAEFKWNEPVLTLTPDGVVAKLGWEELNEVVVRTAPYGSIVYAVVTSLVLGLYVVRQINAFEEEEATEAANAEPVTRASATSYANPRRQKDMEWNLKSFADGPSQQYNRVPLGGAFTPLVVSKEDKIFAMSYTTFEDDMDTLLSFDGGIIFKLFLLPAVLLAAFSHMNAFVLDVSWQGVLLGSLGYGVIDLFGRRFQQICAVVRAWSEKELPAEYEGLQETGLFALFTAKNCQCILEIIINLFKGLCLWFVFISLGTFKNQQVYGWRTGARVNDFDHYEFTMRYAPIGLIVVIGIIDTLFGAINVILNREKPSAQFGNMTLKQWQNWYQLIIIFFFVIAIALQIGHLTNLRNNNMDASRAEELSNWKFAWHVKKWRSSYTAIG